MGTTVTAIAVVTDPLDGEVFGIANVGDSRSYVLRHGRLRQVTVDHSFVQELVAEGAITQDEARTHPRRNIVTRALGIEPGVRVDSWTMPIIRGDRFVLCSDGLVDEIDDDAITEVLAAQPDDPAAAAQALVDAANAAGGRDNITVVIVDVLEGDDPPDPTAEFDVVPVWSEDNLDNTGEHEIVATDDPTRRRRPRPMTSAATTSPPPRRERCRRLVASPRRRPGVAPANAATPASTEAARRPRPVRARRSGSPPCWSSAFAILAAWARSGYFVAFDETGQVVSTRASRTRAVVRPDPRGVGPHRDELDAVDRLVEERRLLRRRRAPTASSPSDLTPTTTPRPPAPTTTTAPPRPPRARPRRPPPRAD